MATEKQTPKEKPNDGFRIRVSQNGPYLVSGGVPLAKQTIGIDAQGYSYEWREGTQYPW